MKSWLFNVIVATDVWLMTVFFRGKRNETISACLYELDRDGKWYGTPLRKTVDFLLSGLERDHCYRSWLIEQKIPLWNGALQ